MATASSSWIPVVSPHELPVRRGAVPVARIVAYRAPTTPGRPGALKRHIEITITRALGKLTAPADLLKRIGEQGLGWLAVQPGHAWQVRALPAHHRDPCD